jgi:sec-independent protein translocase protein TatA
MRIGLTEIIIIALIVLLLFGGKKIPELMSGLGKGVRSFKDGMDGKDEKLVAKKEEETNETANKTE